MKIKFEYEEDFEEFGNLEIGDTFIMERGTASPAVYLKLDDAKSTLGNTLNLSTLKKVNWDFDTLVIPVEAEMIVKQ